MPSSFDTIASFTTFVRLYHRLGLEVRHIDAQVCPPAILANRRVVVGRLVVLDQQELAICSISRAFPLGLGFNGLRIARDALPTGRYWW